jgi:hypothetical protein
MKWVVLPYLKQPLGDLLSLWNMCKARNFFASRAISLSVMFSYYSSEAVTQEDKANSETYEIVLMALASWPPT